MTEEFYDIKGRPICVGDLLKTFHFRGARKKKYWLYHAVVLCEGRLKMVPVFTLATKPTDNGGSCWLDSVAINGVVQSEIIDSYNPLYEDRKVGRSK
jgi:hypothetical protein